MFFLLYHFVMQIKCVDETPQTCWDSVMESHLTKNLDFLGETGIFTFQRNSFPISFQKQTLLAHLKCVLGLSVNRLGSDLSFIPAWVDWGKLFYLFIYNTHFLVVVSEKLPGKCLI